MSESERQYKYRDDRILIEASRVMTPQFSGCVVHLTGSDLEMLRNLTTYLHVKSSWVSSYGNGYYMVPDDTDWDTLQALVAELELTLMGNNNTIFGYNDRVAEEKIKLGALAGLNTLTTPAVPSNEMWCITSITVFNGISVSSPLVLRAMLGTKAHYIFMKNSQPAGIPINVQTQLYMKEGDTIECDFFGTTYGDNLYLLIAGYSMIVP